MGSNSQSVSPVTVDEMERFKQSIMSLPLSPASMFLRSKAQQPDFNTWLGKGLRTKHFEMSPDDWASARKDFHTTLRRRILKYMAAGAVCAVSALTALGAHHIGDLSRRKEPRERFRDASAALGREVGHVIEAGEQDEDANARVRNAWCAHQATLQELTQAEERQLFDYALGGLTVLGVVGGAGTTMCGALDHSTAWRRQFSQNFSHENCANALQVLLDGHIKKHFPNIAASFEQMMAQAAEVEADKNGSVSNIVGVNSYMVNYPRNYPR